MAHWIGHPKLEGDAAHHYVLMRAPGWAGATVPLFVEALNEAGHPVPNPCGDFAPVRAAEDSTLQAGSLNVNAARVEPLVARRLSDEPSSEYYNMYLSDPFVLVSERIRDQELTAIRSSDREVFHSMDGLRVSVDPAVGTSNVLHPFASRVAGQPSLGASAQATTFRAHRILGPNPPPLTGPAIAPGTEGMLSLHNGALEIAAEDLSLPSPRMPLSFVRAYRGQDRFSGPFGPGWDFNYNQRIVRLDPTVVPNGMALPLVLRNTQSEDTIARSRDVLLHNGRGDVVRYSRSSVEAPALPPEYQNDPVITAPPGGGSWVDQISDWYVPDHGVFDALVRFRSGQYARLTPDGTQYWYTPEGRLDKIYDRYSSNRHELSYTDRGELRRISDRSTSTERYFELGYYRAANDTRDFVSGLDVVATSNGDIGLIARLRDNTVTGGAGNGGPQEPSSGNPAAEVHRDVLYTYDAGRLRYVDGVDVAVGAETPGRRRTTFGWNGCAIRSVTDGTTDGLATFAVISETDGVISQATGVSGAISLSSLAANEARSVGGQRVTLTLADGAIKEYQFNTYGVVRMASSSGPRGALEQTSFQFNDPLRPLHPTQIVHGRRNATAFSYEVPGVDPPPLRSRGNVRTITRSTNGLNGANTTETSAYDLRYNLKSGTQVDAEANNIVVTLEAEGRHPLTIQYPGFTETLTFNGRGQMQSQQRADGTRASVTYDAASGNVVSSIDGDVTTLFEYGGAAAIQRGHPTLRRAPLSAPEILLHNELGQVARIQKGAYFERYTRDRNGRVRRIERMVDGAQRYVEQQRYDQRGFLEERTIENIETSGQISNLRWAYTPDALGRVWRQTAPDGDITTFEYDHQGRVHSTTSGQHVEALRYDANGNLVRREVGGDLVEQRFYDGHDRLERLEQPQIGTTRYGYNGNGHVLRVSVEDPTYGPLYALSANASEIDAIGRRRAWNEGGHDYTAVYSTDPSGGLTVVTGPSGIQQVGWDSGGRVTLESVSGLIERMRGYDDAGRVTALTSREGADQRSFGVSLQRDLALGSVSQIDQGGSPLVSFERRTDGVAIATTRDPGELALRTQTPHSVAGEPLGRITPSGVSTSVAFDEQRRAQSVGPGARRRTYQYDNSGRVEFITEQDGSRLWSFGYDDRSNPTNIGMPGGGSITAGYDILGRRTSQTVSFGEFTFAETFAYDALGRLRTAANTTDGTSIAFRYTLPGFLDRTTLTAASQTLSWTQQSYPSGARLSLQYPSDGTAAGPTIADSRTPAGQLVSTTVDGLPLITHVSYEMAGAPGQMAMGPLTRNDRYDDRRRLISRTYMVGGDVRAELRYDYDGANREIARQAMHIGGRTDLFSFDADSRLMRAELEARPQLEEDGTAPWTVQSAHSGNWSAGLYARGYGYSASDASAGQPDTIQQTLTSQWQNELIPAVAAQLAPADDLGHPTLVDGAMRTADGLGNTSTLELEDGPATLVHDGLSRLRRVERANGIVVRYGYRADGMRVSRQIDCPPTPPPGIVCEPRTELLVYHGLQLLEVRETSPVARIRARYFYSDEGDVPIAGDFLDIQTGTLERHYLLTDRQGSVIGVLDDQGTWVERVRYDPWGQPTFETADGQPPALSEVTVLGSGTVQVVFTETVLPPPEEVQSPPDPEVLQVLPNLRPVSQVVRLVDPSASDRVISGTWRYAEGAGTVRGSVITFEPSEALTAGHTYSLVVESGGLLDRWSNAVAGIAQPIVWGSGTLYSGPASTPPVAPAATSAIGNEVLFQSHHYESVLGLYHMRARVFDPRTGMFLELDPSGYRDAANLYAGFANDPVNSRDPTGMRITIGDRKARELLERLRLDPLGRELIEYVQASPIEFVIYGDEDLPVDALGVTGNLDPKATKRYPEDRHERTGQPAPLDLEGVYGSDVSIDIRLNSRAVAALGPSGVCRPENEDDLAGMGEAENLGHELIHAALYSNAIVGGGPLPEVALSLYEATDKQKYAVGTPVSVAQKLPEPHGLAFNYVTAIWSCR